MSAAPQNHHRDSLLLSVMEAVASREGVAVTELPPLSDTINPDALNHIFERTSDPENARTHLVLEYSGHTVRIYPDHTIIID